MYTESHTWLVPSQLFGTNSHLNPFPNRHILLTSYHTNTSSILYILWYLLMQTYYSTLFFFYTCIYLTVHKTLDLFAVTLLSVYHSHNSASQSTVTNSQMHPYIETLRYTHSYYLSHIYSYPLLVNTQPTQSDTCSVQVHHCEWRDSLYSIHSSSTPHILNTVHIFTTLMIISASPSIHTSIHTISLSLSIYMM